MEVCLREIDGLPEDCLVSVRFGTTRRQAPLDAARSRPMKFPLSTQTCYEPLKIDVLQPIASACLVLRENDDSYMIGLDSRSGAPMSVGLDVNAQAATAVEERQAQANLKEALSASASKEAAASARDYLECHGLLRYVQCLLHAIIQVRPDDPYAFMMMQLGAAKGTAVQASSHRAETGVAVGIGAPRPPPPREEGAVPGPRTYMQKSQQSNVLPPHQAAEQQQLQQKQEHPLQQLEQSQQPQLFHMQQHLNLSCPASASNSNDAAAAAAAELTRVDCMRAQLRDALETACTSGALDQTLNRKPREARIGHGQLHTIGQLQSAGTAMSTLPTAVADPDENEYAREQLSRILADAADSGELARAFCKVNEAFSASDGKASSGTALQSAGVAAHSTLPSDMDALVREMASASEIAELKQDGEETQALALSAGTTADGASAKTAGGAAVYAQRLAAPTPSTAIPTPSTTPVPPPRSDVSSPPTLE